MSTAYITQPETELQILAASRGAHGVGIVWSHSCGYYEWHLILGWLSNHEPTL